MKIQFINKQQTVVEDLNNADFNAIYELSNAKLKKALSVQQLKENWKRWMLDLFRNISILCNGNGFIDSTRLCGVRSVGGIFPTYGNFYDKF